MIRITIELIPKDPTQTRTLATMLIANDGTGDNLIGNYDCTLHAEYTGPLGRRGRVTQFRRKQNSVWSLVGAFLKLFGHTKHSPKLMSKSLIQQHTQEIK